MSSATCPKCGNTDVSWIRDEADCAQYMCRECKRGFCYPPETLFDKITASPDALAEKLVYEDFGGWWSVLFDDGRSWDSREAAITATLAELNEVADE